MRKTGRTSVTLPEDLNATIEAAVERSEATSRSSRPA
jgi:metal-responsive CopG/Arc/MetJ family transcriptional regulator